MVFILAGAYSIEQGSWFFDLISPFWYLHYRGLRVLRDRLDIRPVPVLFAGQTTSIRFLKKI